MKYTILIILALILCMLSSPVYTWPDSVENPKVYLSGGDWQSGRWPSYVRDKLTDRELATDIPPQLVPGSAQACRWYIASPAARTYLAQIYNIPHDVAVQYGAHYIKALQVWEDDNIPNRCYCR